MNFPPGKLRMLNQPRPIRVQPDTQGRPVAVRVRGVAHRVARIADQWRIDEGWWRHPPEPISRMYYALELDDGRTITVFQDLVSGHWYEQRA